MTTHPITPTDFDSIREETAVLSIELLARDRRASTLHHAEWRRQRALRAAGLPRRDRTSRSAAARRTIGTYLVGLGTAIAGSPTDARAPKPLDRPA